MDVVKRITFASDAGCQVPLEPLEAQRFPWGVVESRGGRPSRFGLRRDA